MNTHKTTRAHYEKYEAMRRAAHVTLAGSTLFGSKEELQEVYAANPYLNAIPLARFDALFVYHRGKGVVTSLAENICMYKHCILYDILQLTPEFTDV